MVESYEISSKRRRFSPSSAHPTTGPVMTRSRPQICVHHIRLGQIRSDVFRSRCRRFVHLQRYAQASQENLESPRNSHPIGDSNSSIPIKDLRARRVFSPASICDEWDSRDGKEELGVFKEDGIKKRAEGSCPDENLNGKIYGSSSFDVDGVISSCLSDLATESEGNGRFEKLGQQSVGHAVNLSCDSFPCEDRNKNNLDVLEVFENGVKSFDSSLSEKGLEVEKSDKVGGLKVLENTTAGDLDEEFTLTTPPDVDIFGGEQAVAGGNTGGVVDFDSQKINPPPRGGTNLKTKSVLNRCSQKKLFKSPGSFSYGRLLPYLIDVTKESSCDTLAGGCSKSEKSHEQDHPKYNIHGKQENEKADDNSADLQERKEDFDKAKAEVEEDALIKNVSQPAAFCSSRSSTEKPRRNDAFPLKKRTKSTPKRKLVEDPLSRRKLFRTPGSVNYRRMLPFFLDILEDRPCVPENGHHQEHDKRVEEKILSPLLAFDYGETLEGNSDHSYECPSSEMVTSNIAKDTCSNDDPEPLPAENVSESTALFDLEKENKAEHVILDAEKNLEISLEVSVDKNEGPDSSLSSLVSSEPLREDTTSASGHLSLDTIGASTNSNLEAANNAEQAEEESTPLKTLQPEASVSLGTPLDGSPPKGILKRKMSGCRGLCACLNCTSFRLHAEAAFEFSRNQMQDAQEMALNLVGEISYLKEMLEISASVNQTILFPGQVKEACRKASKAAELAKSRLQRMNDDLQVHCRIPSEQRARVKFADYVRQKIIPRMDEPDK